MTTRSRRGFAARVASLTAALGLACASRQQLETAAAKALIPPQQSEALGLQVHEELKKQGAKYLEDPAVTHYVEAVAAPIMALAKKERPDIKDWHVHVIDDPKTVNAFATGGGHMYVYTGLLLAAKDGAELAGVLAHEMGHVVEYHIERQLVDTFGLQAIAGLALGQDPGAVKQIAAAVAGNGLILAHSRSSESEADRWGLLHAAKAGYDATGLVRFFQTLQGEQGQGQQPKILTWLSTHPATPDRIAAAKKLIATEHLSGGGEGPPGLAQAQADIRAHGGASAGAPPTGTPQGTGSGAH
jgi:predicted Zn-dependent protease